MNGVSPVKDQGSCGSCWAFATTATTESFFMISRSTTLDLSEEYVLECSDKSTGLNNCVGGYLVDAFILMLITGMPL